MHKMKFFAFLIAILLPLQIKAMCCEPLCWAEAEYLYWKIKNSPEPVPLVTTGPVVPNLTPVLGQPGTTILIGKRDARIPARSGGRFTFGWWIDCCHIYGTELTYLFLGRMSKTHKVDSNGELGSAFLALPFFDVVTDSESSTRIALPGSFAGSAKLSISNKMQGLEWNGLARLNCIQCLELRALAGFRYWNFDERLIFNTNSPSVVPPPDVFFTKDEFKTRNQFFGGQLGIEGKYCWCDFFLKAKLKIALGAMVERLKIKGLLVTNDFNGFGAPVEFPAGYLAMPTNNGHHKHTRFAVIPEIDINLGYQATHWLSFQVGYTFLYANEVLWAGKQIDRGINPSQAPAITSIPSTDVVGVRRPKPLFKTSSFWAQGLNVGMEVAF